MIKQKRGFWLFMFSLIPGAGEMYMGFRKQGISIMLLFWGIIALAAGLNMGWFIMFLPILWFYSFFNVHNLKSLSPEEFYTLEDRFILNLDSLVGDSTDFMKKYRHIIGLALIVIGACVLWNIVMDFFWFILPYPLANLASSLSYRLPQGLFAVAIVLLGIYLIKGKKKSIEDTYDHKEEGPEEHYWEPYRPSQQPPYPQDTQAEGTRPSAYPADTHPADMPAPGRKDAPQAESPKENPDVILIPPTHGEEMNGHENP